MLIICKGIARGFPASTVQQMHAAGLHSGAKTSVALCPSYRSWREVADASGGKYMAGIGWVSQLQRQRPNERISSSPTVIELYPSSH